MEMNSDCFLNLNFGDLGPFPSDETNEARTVFIAACWKKLSIEICPIYLLF